MNELLDKFLYEICVSIFFLIISIYFFYLIGAFREKRLTSFRKRKLGKELREDQPFGEEYAKNFRKQGVQIIEDRFRFFRRAYPLIIFPIWIFLLFIPQLQGIPSIYIPIFAAVFSVIIGVALRPFLENLFSGVVVSFFRSIRIGDTVIVDGNYGIIEDVGLTYTILRRWDFSRIVIPNTKLLQKEIENLTMTDNFIWAYVEFNVAPDADLELVEKLAKKFASESQFNYKPDEPSFWVMGMEKDSIKCWVAGWANSPGDAWEFRNEVRTNLYKEFQKEGIAFQKIRLAQD